MKLTRKQSHQKTNQNTINYIDNIVIITRVNHKNEALLEIIEQLKNYTHKAYVLKLSHKIESGYTIIRSKVVLTGLRDKALKLLFDNEIVFGDYSISMLELACDDKPLINPDSQYKETRKKYSRVKKIHSGGGETDRSDIDPTLIKSTPTLQFDNPQKAQQAFKQYERKSKIIGIRSNHSEFILNKPSNIQKRTGIITIGDLISFNIKDYYEKTHNKYIFIGEQIDHYKLGRWLLKIKKRKLTETEKKWITFRGSCYCRLCQKKDDGGNIYFYAQLMDYYKKEVERFKSKPGRKTKREQRFLRMPIYKFVKY